MTMTEQTTETPKPKKPRRERAARAKAPAALPAQARAPSEMEGITVSDCPIACVATRCVISLRGICAHPGKGGLQAPLQTPKTLRRFGEAKRALGQAKLDLTK